MESGSHDMPPSISASLRGVSTAKGLAMKRSATHKGNPPEPVSRLTGQMGVQAEGAGMFEQLTHKARDGNEDREVVGGVP
jgi:phytoene/squalene synthetase